METESLVPVEYNRQRILLTSQLAESYETTPDVITKNYNRNMEHYQEGKHFYCLEGEEKREFLNQGQFDSGLKNATRLYLWTEKGALLQAKSLGTDRAWEVYDLLVEAYFKAKELTANLEDFSPELRLLINLETAQRQQEKRMTVLESANVQLIGTVGAIRDAVAYRPDTWRQDVNRMLNKIAETLGDRGAFQEIRASLYSELEGRAHCDLDRRLANHRSRLLESGATKTAIGKANKLDTIEQDPKLREIFLQIVKEALVRFGVELPGDRKAG